MSPALFAFPMSFAQQRLWFLEQMNQSGATYNISGALRLVGPLHVAALHQALHLLIARHESLRTTCAFVNNQPAQMVIEHLTIPLPVICLDPSHIRDDEVQRLAAEEARQPFDLTGGPLLRVSLIRCTDTEHVLLTTMHHIISDGWSSGILLRELSTLYRVCLAGGTSPLPELALQYADFAHWQREWLQGDVLERQLAYWRKQLANPSILHLPLDYPRPPVQTFNGAVESFVVSAALGDRLKAVSRRERVTLFTLLLAAFQVLLHRYSGQDDILVGVPVANRNRTELEGIIGLFVNTLVLRANLSDNPAFRELLQRVHQTALNAYAHQDLPFEKLVEELSPARNLRHMPLFQVAFSFQDASTQTLAMPDITEEHLAIHTGTAKFDLTLDIEATADGLRCVIEYNTDLFMPCTIARMATHFQHLLTEIAADAGRRVGNLPLLTGAEHHQLEQRNTEHRQAEPTACLHRLFEQQARQYPESIAVVYQEQQLSYSALDRRANQLAQYLRQRGVGPDTLVGLYVERSVDLVLGILGILKAGGAYVPVDPAYPLERVAFMLEDCQASVIVTTSALASKLPTQRGCPVYLDRAWDEIAQCPTTSPQVETTAEHLAYIIYTSGSTGRPKGVAVTHANVVRLFQETRGWMHFDHTDVWTLFHSYAFDFSVWELWGALLHGGRLVVVPYDVSRSPDAFYALLSAAQVTVLNQTPSAFRQLIQIEAQRLVELQQLALRYVILGGEALNPGYLKPWFERRGDQQPQIINMYGITETTVHVTYRRIMCADSAVPHSSPIGCPIPDLRMHLLDRYLNPVPIGVTGEIYVGGAGLARGYLGRPELTAQRFIPDPFNGSPTAPSGARLYRTGDTARYLPNGDLEYLGRADTQVKIRGFRIELEEIDAVLRQYPGVRDCLTQVREDTPGDKKLVAYLLTAADLPLQPGELRQFLQAKLPEYMLPAAFVYLPAFPLTENGKIDRAALPAPGEPALVSGSAYTAPRSAMEEVFAAIWSKALNVTRVGVHDNFFALGGDSILSLQILALAKQRGIQFSLQQLFQNPTIAELAQAIISDVPAAQVVRTQPMSLLSAEDRQRLPDGIEDAYPLAMLQSGMLYHMALAPDSNIYHNTDSYHFRTKTPFDLALFQQAVAAIVQRHPILRTGFDLTGYSEPLQLVHTHATLPVELHDLRQLAPAEQQQTIDTLIEHERGQHFDIAVPSLLRFFIHLRTDDSFQFTLTECHAIIDGWSLQSTLVEIFQHYFALLHKRAIAEPAPLDVSYRDFVSMERDALNDEAQRRFWTRHLDQATSLQLPSWPTAAPTTQPQIQIRATTLSAELSEGLQDIVKATALPLKSILLAAHIKVMSLIGGQTDVLTGVGMNGRPETIDGAQLRGLFINTVPFRLRVRPGSWLDLIQQTFATDQEIFPFRRYPVAAIQQQWGRQPLYEVMFNYLNFHVVSRLADVIPDIEELGAIRSEGTNAALLVHFQIQPLSTQLTLDLDYDPARLCQEQIEQISGYYISILNAMVADLHQPHHTHTALSAAERRRLLVEWNTAPAAYPREQRLHELFEAQARRTPDAVAVVHERHQLTYAELDARANQLAHTLQAYGVGPNVCVGLLTERSHHALLGILGILKAGGAYLPLDPAYPAERLLFMLEESGVSIVVTQDALLPQISLPATRCLCLDADWTAIAQQPSTPPICAATPDDLTYVIYTSGSTGIPKGAGVFQRGVLNLVHWYISTLNLSSADRALIISALSFDLTQKNLFAPLLVGGSVHFPASTFYNPQLLAETIGNDGITLINCTPSAFYPLLDAATGVAAAQLASLRYVVLGGEPIAAARIDAWVSAHAATLRVINSYGPTECTDVVSALTDIDLSAFRQTAIPIGRPLPDSQLYVLDQADQPTPVGVVGNLHIGGAGVGLGYLKHPALTAERFIPDPFSRTPGARLYRSGDRARWLPNGVVEFLGRSDQQVKLRGFRVELGEIEAALVALEAVQDAAVLVYDQADDAQQLVAYIVPANERTLPAMELRAALRQTLPEYMIPNLFVSLAALPLTPSGKVDRRALPAPTHGRPETDADYVVPQNDLERMLASVWKNVLKIDQVGIHDNFFELGGHSLLIIRMHTMVQEQLGRELPVTDVLQYPTIHALANYLSQGTERAAERSHRRIDARREASKEMTQRSQLREQRHASRKSGGDDHV